MCAIAFGRRCRADRTTSTVALAPSSRAGDIVRGGAMPSIGVLSLSGGRRDSALVRWCRVPRVGGEHDVHDVVDVLVGAACCGFTVVLM